MGERCCEFECLDGTDAANDWNEPDLIIATGTAPGDAEPMRRWTLLALALLVQAIGWIVAS